MITPEFRPASTHEGKETTHYLMSSTYEVQIVLLQKTRYNVRAKSERYPATVLPPASDVFIRIRPEQVTKDAFFFFFFFLARQEKNRTETGTGKKKEKEKKNQT